MADVRDEDLFVGSSMSFGDHLEELRTCLFKAVVGLVICTVIGFFVGKYVVEIIKAPLEKGLTNYYQQGAIADYAKFVDECQEQGLEPPYSLQEVTRRVNKEYMICTIYQDHLAARKAAPAPKTDPAAAAHPAENTGAGGGAPAPNPKAAASGKQPGSGEPNSEPPGFGDSLPHAPLVLWRSLSDDERTSLKTFSALEGFMIWLKASLLAGAILSSPWVFYQLWTFVAAGLYPNEKQFVHLYLPFSIGLFLTGAALGYFVFRFVLDFLFSYNRSLGLAPELRINEWLGFALMLPIGFGISFQLPLVMLFLNRIGIFSIEAYWSKWRVSVLVIFIIAMILTPADPYSMLAMALPLTVLYFGGILLCQYMRPPKNLLDQ